MARKLMSLLSTNARTMSRLERLQTVCAGFLGGPYLLAAPIVIFLAAFFVTPLLQVAWMSIAEPSFGLQNFATFFTSAYDLKVLRLTFQTATIVTIVTLLLSYPIAYVAARAGGRLGMLLILVVTLSFWTSFLVRTYAWMVILGAQGPLAMLFRSLGLPPPQILFTTTASTLVMAHMLVPFMVLSLYAVMRRIDEVYMRAAESLGASRRVAFLRVYLPLSLPGVVNGSTLVFATCLGFYVTPALIGSPQDMMISGRIGQQIEQLVDFGGASATAMVLLVATLLLFGLYNRFFGLDRLWR